MSTPQNNSETRHFNLVIIGGGYINGAKGTCYEK